jgi:phosphatidylglycerol lysyltransferase
VEDANTGRTAADTAAVRGLIAKHGWNVCSCQIHSPGIEHWVSADGDSAVGYVTRGRSYIAAGAPICAPDQLRGGADAWERKAGKDGKHVCYFGAMDPLYRELMASGDHSAVVIGALPVWHPATWQRSIDQHPTLKAQFRRARNAGVTVVEWSAERASRSESLWSCYRDWRSRHNMPPLMFVSGLGALQDLASKRIFIALRGGEVVAFLILMRVPARYGWMAELYPRRSDAPNGTVDLLIHYAVLAVADAGAEMFTLGLSPLTTSCLIGVQENPAWVRSAFTTARHCRAYSFGGLERFKQKFRPEVWEPVYCIGKEARFSVRTLAAAASAFIDGQHTSAFVRTALTCRIRHTALNLRGRALHPAPATAV